MQKSNAIITGAFALVVSLATVDIPNSTSCLAAQTDDQALTLKSLGPESIEPPYAKKESFSEIAVKIGSAPYELDGTLSLPNGSGPYPAVVLIHGSGPNDRDETIGAVKVFRDLAWGLASKEIAVLRFEKRTKQYGKAMMADGSFKTVTVQEETIDDALSAVAFLANDKRIEKNHIYILGHSLGAMLIPRMAKGTDLAAGFIVMAGPTRPLEDMILEQSEYLLSTRKDGAKTAINASGQKQLAQLKLQVKAVKDLNLNSSKTNLPLGLPASYWLDLRDYKPADAMKEIKKPILILQGGKDYQVTMTDFQNLWQALNEKSNATFKVYNGLNHGFVPAGAASTASDYEKAQNVSVEIINDINKWVKSQD